MITSIRLVFPKQPTAYSVGEDQIRLMIGDLGHGIETILGQDDFAARLNQENLGASTNGIAVVDHHDLDARQIVCLSHATPMLIFFQFRSQALSGILYKKIKHGKALF